jgi:hypothetical protein
MLCSPEARPTALNPDARTFRPHAAQRLQDAARAKLARSAARRLLAGRTPSPDPSPPKKGKAKK